MSVPTFAVVGQPNKGKSSIVATLAEDERIAISPVPGTTRTADRHTLSLNGETLYVLVDTPGFQRPRAVLAWLKARENDASQRRDLVAQFVDAHANDERFHDECELLRPILAGAGILYVVDGAKPYGAEYEIEMQILQWTGQPRMALINRIGDDDYRDEWRRALDQYFSIVREFDAVSADFETRLSLLSAFAEIDESWRESLSRAVAALRLEWDRRLHTSAREIAVCLADCLVAEEQVRLGVGDDRAAREDALRGKLLDRVRAREARMQKTMKAIYRHEQSELQTSQLDMSAIDLFSEEGWELFGLSREKLVVAGALGGAAAGGGLDLLVGGSSLLMGSVLGGLFGGVSAWLGGSEIAKVKVLGEPLGGKRLQVGPITAANFPWVLLGRAAAHHRLVSERNHARREAISLELSADQHFMDAVPDVLRRRLARAVSKVRKGDGGIAELSQAIEELLKSGQTTTESNR